MSKIISLALLAAVLPATAQAQEPSAITVQGHNFSYQKTDLSPSTFKLVGQTTDGRYFRLSVKGRRVSGDFGDQPVYFVMPEPGSVAAATVLASLQ